MTIDLTDNAPRISYSVSQGATTTSFAVPFEFFDTTDLKVVVDGTTKTITTHYTVSGGNGSTGTVTMSVTGATGGSTVIIYREIPLSRTTDFPASGAFPIATLNTELDRTVALFDDRKDRIDRSIRLLDTDDAATMTLPTKDNRKGTVLGFNATTGAVEAGPTIANVSSLADITTNINTVAGIASNVTTVAGIQANVTTVAGISSNVSTVAGISSNVTTVAGKASLITSDFAADMSLVTSDFVTDMNLVTSDFITDMNLVTSDFVADMALVDSTFVTKMALVTSDFVTDMSLVTADFVSDVNTLATSDIVSDLNTLATSDIVSDLNTLATADIVSDLNTLATSDIVSDLNQLATSDFVSDLNAVEGIKANVTTVAGVSSNVTTVAGISSNVTTVAGISANVTTVAGNNANVTTVASNITGVNSFAERYRVGSSDPSSSLDEGDLFYNSSDNSLKYYNGSSWQAITPVTTGISSGNVPVFTSGAADNDFLRIDGTSIEGRSASEVLSDIGAIASSGGTFSGDVILNSDAVSLPSFASATNEGAFQVYTSEITATNLWDDINADGNNYSSMPSEISVSNVGNNTTNSFAGLFMMAGETSDNLSVNAARIGAIRESSKATAIGFAARQSGGDMVEVGRFKSTKEFNITGDIELEGANYITTLTKTAPTANRTITFPDTTGTVALTSDLSSYAPLTGATFTGEITADGGINEDHNNGALSNSNQTLTLDAHDGNNFSVTTAANITSFVVSKLPASGTAFFFTLKITFGGSHSITWGSAVKWAGGTAPTLSTSGTDIFSFYTIDSGTTIYGFTSGQALA